MATLLEYKCPCCGGALSFDSQLQKMKCPYCDTEFEMETLKSYDDEFDALNKLNAETGAKIPGSLVGIKEKPVVHKNVVKKEDMLTFVGDMVGKKEWIK